MPSESELPPGARREFVELLFDYYRKAGRPTLRRISEWIKTHDDLAGTASRETTRCVLNGTTVPVQWSTAEAVFLALCVMANVDPDGTAYEDFGEKASHWEQAKQRWNDALDEPPNAPPSPWSDEPPF